MFGNTKNKFLDLLLNKYKSICDSSGISFEYNIRTANLSFMDAPDLITLLSNILDNAVEAASVSEKKTIELSINRVNEFDMLSCVNSSDRKPQSVGKSLRTSKNSGGFHGLGTKSIKAMAGKYNGEFDWAYSEAERENTMKKTVVRPFEAGSLMLAPVSYTQSPSPRDQRGSRMPSSA